MENNWRYKKLYLALFDGPEILHAKDYHEHVFSEEKTSVV